MSAVLAILAETLILRARPVARDVRSRQLGLKCGLLAFGAEGLWQASVLYALQLAVYEHRLFDLGFGVGAWLLAFFVNDLMFYVSHRVQHRVRLLWTIHAVHHSARHFDLTTGVRGSALGFLTTFPFVVWIPLLGVHPVIVFTADKLFKFWGLAYHTEFIDRMGPLERVLITPSHHRVHHGTNPRYVDRNYGGLLVIFDKLFGSFEPEVEAVQYGLVKDWHGYGLWDCQTHELTDLWRDMRGAATWREALGYALRPPGWRPSG
ncbi:MAG: sterol desaturase family protein [Alphaproteobacteria bacterium]|nr:sterol desaturase family protein [Alphaproteobacteria bacterium]